jgi:exosortase B
MVKNASRKESNLADTLVAPANKVWWPIAIALLAMYWPAILGMFRDISSDDGQGQGIIILALAAWLIYRSWPGVNSTASSAPSVAAGGLLFASALLLFVAGKMLSIVQFDIGSLIPMLMAIVLTLRGPKQLRVIAFPLFFLLFLIPLPRPVADALTHPMKIAVSHVAEWMLQAGGLPVARAGVVLQVGPYQLLVADACAGLYTLFTLESMGLLYLNVVHSSSVVRNIVLAILIVPISFFANVFRVVVLCLITYYFGDAAGQGYLHGFAGIVLFLTAFLLIVTADSALRAVGSRRASAGMPA